MSLETEANEFSVLFKRHLSGSTQAQIRWVTCKSVNWDAKTMEAEGMSDELAYYDIALGFGSCDTKPVVNTDCIIGILEGQESVAWLIYASEVELLEFNSGENGGLTNVTELKTQLDKLTARVDGIISAINSSTIIPVPSDGGAALLTLLRVQIATIVDKEDFGDIEDTKITH
ncbi:MAG TPA: hypothetical protein VIK29_07050 [Paludibacter sp.]